MRTNGEKPLRPGVGQNLGMDTPTRTLGRWKKGQTGNPGGRPKTYPEMRALCQQKTIAGIEAVDEILHDPAQPGSTRVAAWCALRDTGFDRPAQRIAIKDYTEHPASNLLKDGDNVERFADMYAMMIGATNGEYPPPIIDVTPSQSRALPCPRDDEGVSVDELRRLWAEEDAEQQSAHASRPQSRERIRRMRR